jgi:tetratricopeptide (TPR) repeat protein
MKKSVRYIFMGLLLLVSSCTFAQVALLDRVYDMIQKSELNRAMEAIALAEKNTITAMDARTFYLKAFVNKELLMSDTANRVQYRDIMIASIQRCQELDSQRTFDKAIIDLRDFALASVFNDGSDSFNHQRYEECIQLFKWYCKLAEDEDSYFLDAKYFIGSSYNELHTPDSALAYFEFVKARNYDQPLLYVDLSYLYFNKNEEQHAMAALEAGLTHFPTHFDLQIAQLNVLAGFQRYDTLEHILEKFLVKNPDNIDALLMAGTTYEKNRTEETRAMHLEKAEKVYREVIRIDPENFDANYNLGVLFYNEAVDIVNKNDIDTDIAELTKVLERSTVLFEKALPLLLVIHDPNESSLKLLQALQAIYYNLNMKVELLEVNNLIAGHEKG